MDSETLNLIFGIVGLAGTIFGVWSFFRMKEEKEPQCCYKTYKNLVKLTNAGDLRITYKGLEVNQISTTYIFFWNKGRRPIKKEDMPSPLLISFPSQVTVLDYQVLKISREEIHFSANRCVSSNEDQLDNALLINFDFLDKNDGGVIEVKHTGSLEVKPSIRGTILSVPDGIPCKEIKGERLSRVSIRSMFSKGFKYSLLYPTAIIMIMLAIYMYGREPLIFVLLRLVIISPFIIGVSFATILMFMQPWIYLPYPRSLDIGGSVKTY